MATRFYLSDLAAPYTPATIRGSWDQTSGHVARALIPNKRADDGDIDGVQVTKNSATQPRSILLGRFVSAPLAAQTLSGNVEWVIGVDVSNADADAFYHVHIYVTQGDSDTPRGTLLNNYQESTAAREWPSTDRGWAIEASQSISSLAIQDGDRIVVEIGAVVRTTANRTYEIFYGTVVNGQTGVVVSGDLAHNEAAVSTKASWIEFSGDFPEYELGTEIKLTQFGVLALSEAPAPPVRLTQAGLLALVQNVVEPEALTVSVSESITVTDVSSTHLPGTSSLVVFESISVSDSASPSSFYAYNVFVHDVIVVSDVVSRAPAANIIDSISITEVVILNLITSRLSVKVWDNISIAEFASRQSRSLRLNAILVENIRFSDFVQVIRKSSVWDGGGVAPSPGLINTGDYWTEGI